MSELERKFIVDYLTEMTTQNNRITRHPYFYIIRHPDYIPSADGSGDERCNGIEDEKTVWYYNDDPSCEFNSEEELHEHLLTEEDIDEDKLDDEVADNWTECRLVLIWRESGLFLTESDAEAHLKSNHYHYGHGAHTYVKHAWRAYKYEAFMKALFEHFRVERRVPKDPPL